jgi:hypothetical protein
MSFNTNYLNTLGEISELAIWSSNVINILDAEELEISDFYFYRELFKKKFEEEKKSKSEFIKICFDFAKKAIEILCKTIAGSNGSKQGNIGKK